MASDRRPPPKPHEWECRASTGLIEWVCERCPERHMLTVVSAANPERLRSMLIILEDKSCLA